MFSVLEWQWSELRGAGDLRSYGAVQSYSALVILIAFLFPQGYTRASDFGLVIGFYAVAKVLELFDKQVFALLHVVSGHSLKHNCSRGRRLLHFANVAEAEACCRHSLDCNSQRINHALRGRCPAIWPKRPHDFRYKENNSG